MNFLTILKIIGVVLILIALGVGVYYLIHSFGALSKVFGSCSPTLNVGATCSKDCECYNDACGRESAADGATTVCCKSGENTRYDGYDYCTKMPDESVCWSDAMCATGYCRDNNGGLQKGLCGKLAVGKECKKNEACLNGACGRASAADGASLACCASGDFTTYGGYDYCAKMPDGNVCWSDAMCATGYCRENAGGTQKGVCGKLDVGQPCTTNNTCVNGACGRESAADGAPLACCASGDFTTYAGYDYCAKMPDGNVCWSDAMCATGYCRENAGGTQRGICGKLAVGQQCTSNGSCVNGACGRSSGVIDAPLACCASTDFTTFAGRDYCAKMPAGTVCKSDSMCASGTCKGNAGGLQTGNCT